MNSAIGLIACTMLSAILARGEESATEIVKRSLDLEHRNWRRAKDYTFQQRDVFREVDSAGRVKSTRSHTYDISMLYGRPYRRLIEKEGKSLSAAEQTKQDEQLRKEAEKRRRQSEDENSKERRDFERQRAEQRKFLDELPQAFDFRLLREEAVSGKPAWVVAAQPKPGYQPHDSRARMFAKIHGTLWIDKAEYQWVKVDAETTDTISFGLFLARLAPGSSFHFEQQRVNDEVWLPSHALVTMEGRLALVKKMRGVVDVTYTQYKKFQSDSKMLSTETAP
jgi:hypothetical protein